MPQTASETQKVTTMDTLGARITWLAGELKSIPLDTPCVDWITFAGRTTSGVTGVTSAT
ncbi:MAG: hypothetical protein AAFN77_22960 [Planctomycetota bacterium]